jgi:hypothetical protein
MVKTRIETYLPRLYVGASSDTTASEVSSLIPAPTPEIAMPPAEKLAENPLADMDEASVQCTDEGVHAVSCGSHNHANNK